MLDDETIARYARQIVIPGVGAAGQQRLFASTVLVAGDPRGGAQAALYLRAAGVRVVPPGSGAADLVVVADANRLADPVRREVLALGKPVCWYVVDEDGFTTGVHPEAPLPCPVDEADATQTAAPHDAAACEAASVACGILLGLRIAGGTARFDW